MLFWHRVKEEDFLITHLSVVLKNVLLFTDDVVGLLLCFPNSTCTALPCLVALSCSCTAKWEQNMEVAPCGSGAVWDVHVQRWSSCNMSLKLRGVSCMSSPTCVSVSNLSQPSSCDALQRCLQEGDKLTLVTLASPQGEKSSQAGSAEGGP